MKKSTKIKLIRALTSSTDYTDKDKLRLIKNLLDETLPSSTRNTQTKATEFPIISEDATLKVTVDPKVEQYLTTTTSNPRYQLQINQLPDKIASRVLELYNKDETYETLPNLIKAGFVWSKTTEGHEYWQKLYTIITHFQTLPQPYQDQAIKNIDMDFVKGSRIDTLAESIGNGFFWKNTEQGYDYWDKLYDTL